MDYKQQLIDHLKGLYKSCKIDNVMTLWGESKTYFDNKGIPMGGSYASWETDITVNLNVNKEILRFKVDLSELK
jgi:hypothetical protein